MSDELAAWDRKTVSGIAAAVLGGGTPSRDNPAYWDGGISWVTPGELTNIRSKYLHETAETISTAGLVNSGARTIPERALLVTTRATLGLVALAASPITTNQGFKSIVFDDDAHPDFYYHLFATLKRQMERRASGTTFLEISTGQFGKIEVPSPPKGEQRRIAEILDTVDDQIRLTESATSKLRATFVGLLSHLLTQGVRSNPGPLGDASLEFGETSISLPKSWTIEPIGRLLGSVDPAMRSGPFGSALLKHELVESGVPLLGIDNVHVDQFVSDFRRFVTPAKAVELSRYRVRPSDVMVTIMGTVGRSCVVPEDIGHALSSKHVWTLTFDDARYRPYLASLQLNHAPWARAHLRRDEQGGIMSAIRSDTLRTLMLPTPPIDEQLEIEATLKALETKIANQENSLTKLRALKAGLAEDLLTGRVRIPEQVAP